MFFEKFRHLTGFRGLSRTHGGISKGVLERSFATKPRKISPDKRDLAPKFDHHVVSTFNPNEFVKKKQQPIPVGNLQSFRPRITLHKQPVLTTPRLAYDWTYQEDGLAHRPFPEDTKAFLYYTTPPGRPRIGSELRLRVTSSNDPASFASGSDLLRTNGQPWSRPLYALSKYYPLLYEKLREERLVPDDLDAVLSTLPSKTWMYSRSQLLYTLNDEFIIDFSNTSHFFPIITEQGIERLPFLMLFCDHRATCGTKPYTGSALARFERSTFPDHKGTRTIVLRFLKIITPVQCLIPLYDGHIMQPTEGALHHRARFYSKKGHVMQVWSVNLDKPKGAMVPGLQLLWDS